MHPELIDQHLPFTVQYSDFIHQGTSLRDMRARVVTIMFNPDALGLNEIAKDKLIHLVGKRYDEKTGLVTIVADR